jgi:AAA+ superfamily predicted ATPase
MIKDLGNRAALSPYLLCFLSIDDFDLLVPDRNIEENKNNEALSALLSTFGGNRDVPNLLLTASTDDIYILDWAISNRFKDHFKVNLPS